ncbi:hypothetical protein AC249_AIPGENE12771 [Exaiptasia diaphana]|nr:hypothetical protein AC249_AIPGENE12771 [Exaiptasia diaphana]
MNKGNLPDGLQGNVSGVLQEDLRVLFRMAANWYIMYKRYVSRHSLIEMAADANCSQGCVNGNCTNPDVCSCLPGYRGNSCSKREYASHNFSGTQS